MATAPNYDYDMEQDSIMRKQKLLEAMSQGAMNPQPSGAKGKYAALGGISELMKVMMGIYGQKQLGEEKAALGERYKKDLTTGMDKFMKTSEGAPTPNFVMQNDGMGGAPDEVRANPNPRKAALDALASNHPVLRELGMKQLTAKPDQITAKDALGHMDPKSVVQNPMDPTKWMPKADVRVIDNAPIDVSDRKMNPLAPNFPMYSDPVKMGDGDLYQGNNLTGKLNKLDNAPKVNVNSSSTNVAAGQKEGLKTYFESAAKKVNALGEMASSAQDNKNTLAELANLDAKGIFSNVTTGPATFLSNLGQLAGIQVDTNKLGNTEAYNALTTDLWQGLVSKYGGNRGVTADEAKEIKKMLPLAATSPEARQNLFTVLGNVADRQIAQYQTANDAFARSTKMEDPEIFSKEFGKIYTPSPGQTQPALSGPKSGAPGKPMSLDDYLKAQQGAK